MASGTVKWFDPVKGYGFAQSDDGSDMFVHRSALPFGELLSEGDRIRFDVETGAKGASAVRVEIIERSGNPPRFAPTTNGGYVSPAASRTPPASGPFLRGTVARYDVERGFGFIRPQDNGPDIFVHRSAAGRDLLVGETIEFRLGQGQKGPRAEQVRPIDARS